MAEPNGAGGMDDLVEYARSRAERGEEPSPDAAAAMRGWESLNDNQRFLRAAMLESVDPALGAEARGYLQGGWFAGAGPQGDPMGNDPHTGTVAGQQRLIRDIDEWAAEEEARKRAAAAGKKEEGGLTAGTGALAGAAAGLLVPPLAIPMALAGATLGKGAEEARKNATTTQADADARLKGGKMEAPPSEPQGDLLAGLVVPQGGGGGGVLTPGTQMLRGHSTQATQLVEPEEARRMREAGMGDDLLAAQMRYDQGVAAAREIEGIARERQNVNERFQVIEQEHARREAQIRAENERRIAEAEKAFEEAAPDPNWNPYWEIANGDDWGKKIMLGLGSLLGGLGAATSRDGRNYFLEQMNAGIQRRLELSRQKREHLAQTVKGRKDAYSRALEALGSKKALDDMEEARMWKALDLRIEQVAAQLGVESTLPQFLELRAAIQEKYRAKMMESAKQVTQVSQAQEAFQPIVAVGGGGKDPVAEGLEKILEAREKKGLPKLEAALDNMNGAILTFIQDPNIRDQLAVALTSGQTSSALRLAVPYLAKNPQAIQSLVNAINTYRESIGGKALTPSEAQNIALTIGSGDITAVQQFYADVEATRNALEADVAAAYPQAYQIFWQNRRTLRNAPGPQSSYPAAVKPPVGGAPVSR